MCLSISISNISVVPWIHEIIYIFTSGAVEVGSVQQPAELIPCLQHKILNQQVNLLDSLENIYKANHISVKALKYT